MNLKEIQLELGATASRLVSLENAILRLLGEIKDEAPKEAPKTVASNSWIEVNWRDLKIDDLVRITWRNGEQSIETVIGLEEESYDGCLPVEFAVFGWAYDGKYLDHSGGYADDDDYIKLEVRV